MWRFSIDVATSWERVLTQAATPRTRKVAIRSAMAVSWIHERDFVHAVNWLIEHDTVEGAVNLAAPQPLPNAQFMRSLRDAWGTRLGLRLLQHGFAFQFPSWPEAARDLCRRWRLER